MSRLIRSSAFTLAFGYVVLGIVALVLFAAPLWYAWQVTIEDGRTQVLQEETLRFNEVFRRSGPDGLMAFINERMGLQIARERVLLLADSSLEPLAGNMPSWPRDIPAKSGTYTVNVDLGGQPEPIIFVCTTLPGGYNMLVGTNTGRLMPLESHFWSGLAEAVGVLVITGVLGGIMIRRALLSRIQSIGQTVTAIMQGNLSHRLPTQDGRDELDILLRTINRMLEQIEHLVHGVRNVSNAIAHDLRTPLAELRSRLEELAFTRPSPEETFSEIDGAVADVDRVIRIFNALLRLAEIDAGLRRSGFVQVDIAGVASEAVEFYQPAAELKGMSLSCSNAGVMPVSGDPVLLAQALGNLIDNALKYGPGSGNIVVGSRERVDGAIEITVSDNGPGIPDVEKPKVAERFYRCDTSRGTPGIGLGLSLVSAVAKLHGGILELADNHPGLRASMVIDRGTAALST